MDDNRSTRESGLNPRSDSRGRLDRDPLTVSQAGNEMVTLVGEPRSVRSKRAKGVSQVKSEIFESILESSSDSVVVFDKYFNFIYANQSALDQIHMTPDELIGKNIRDVQYRAPGSMCLWTSQIEKLSDTGQVIRTQDELIMDGKLFCSESVVHPINSPAGKLIAVSIISRDVTEQKALLAHQKQNEQFFKDIYESAFIPLFRISAKNGQLVNCNQAFANLLGYTKKDVFLREFESKGEEAFFDLNEKASSLKILTTKQDVDNFEVKFTRRCGAVGYATLFFNNLCFNQDLVDVLAIDVTPEKLLTKTEKKILSALLKGKSNKEIGHIMNRSVRTIEDHRSNIMQKLVADNVFELGKTCLFFK